MMFTRRKALLAALGSAAAFQSRPLWAFAKEFWNEKDPDQWAAEEIDMLLNHSPWAKEVTANMRAGAMDHSGGSSRKDNKTKLGGGMGGAGMGPSKEEKSKADANVVIGSFRGLVRWESAAPIMLAQKKEPLSGEAAEHYIIGISGLPMAGARQRAGDDSNPDAEEMAERIIDATKLTSPGRPMLLPVKADATKPNRGTLLFFRRDAEQFTLDHKELTLQTKVGPLEIKTKFALKEMLYRGKLEL